MQTYTASLRQSRDSFMAFEERQRGRAELLDGILAEGCRILSVYDVDPHTEDEYGPDGLVMINTDIDEPGDLREWLGDKLEQQNRLLQRIERHTMPFVALSGDAAIATTPLPTIDGVSISVSPHVDVESFFGDYGRPHAIFIVDRGSSADARLAVWPPAQLVDNIAIAGDGSNPRLIDAPSSRWEQLILDLVSQWIAVTRAA